MPAIARFCKGNDMLLPLMLLIMSDARVEQTEKVWFGCIEETAKGLAKLPEPVPVLVDATMASCISEEFALIDRFDGQIATTFEQKRDLRKEYRRRGEGTAIVTILITKHGLK